MDRRIVDVAGGQGKIADFIDQPRNAAGPSYEPFVVARMGKMHLAFIAGHKEPPGDV
jgi:hypothetical protein